MAQQLTALLGCLFLFGSLGLGTLAQLQVQPEQVHLAYTGVISEMLVSWVTQSQVNESVVEYGTTVLDSKMKGSSVMFVDGGPAHRNLSIHKVKLTGLTPGQRYLYHVGSELGWSNLFTFEAMRQPSSNGPGIRFAVYGDMGNKNAQAMSWLQEEAQMGKIDGVLHVGDFAYDMDTDDALVGDAFMRQIESVAAYVPYMTCPGNHEAAYNFSNYKNRFSMPGGSGDSMFYSFNIGPAHIIAVNTEVYSQEEQSRPTIMTQYHWLEQDLKEANEPNRRAAQPWIIVMGHRPMYCSNNDGPFEHCNNPSNPIRLGFYAEGYPGLEDILYKYGVDLMYFAHEHSYERLWPVYNSTVCNGTKSPYVNPGAPVHIITGSAGNQEGQTGFDPVVFPWSGFHSDDFGYTRMTLINATHLYLEQVSTDQGGVVIDKMTLVKDKHGAGLYNCHKTSSDENFLVKT